MLFNTATGRKIINTKNVEMVYDIEESQIYVNKSTTPTPVFKINVNHVGHSTSLCFEDHEKAKQAFLLLASMIDQGER